MRYQRDRRFEDSVFFREKNPGPGLLGDSTINFKSHAPVQAFRYRTVPHEIGRAV